MSYEQEIAENAVYVPPGKTPLDVLAEFHKKCVRAGGRPLYKTSFGRALPKGTIIMACMFKGKKVPGGTLTGIPVDLWEAIRKASKGKKWEVVEDYLKAHGLF